MKAAMYIFANRGLGMSAGKLAAQASHAAVEAYRLSDKKLIDDWYQGEHYMKLIMLARDTEHLLNIERYLHDRGIRTSLIIDEGMTEVDPHSPTALGCALVDKDDPDTQAIFSTFELYKDTVKVYMEIER